MRNDITGDGGGGCIGGDNGIVARAGDGGTTCIEPTTGGCWPIKDD